MEKLNKGMMIDGCAGTSALDSQGEKLNIEGVDISALVNGLGRINDNHLKSFAHSIGRIVDAKKIFKKEDCDNDRQKMYWDKVKRPYIYVSGELYDDVDHPNARATAAIMKHLDKANAPLSVKMSVEGSVLARADGGVLDRTKVHSVALTFTPANKETLALPMDGMIKSDEPVEWEALIKSVTLVDNVPAFIENEESLLTNITEKVVSFIEQVTALKKALTAGYPGGGDSSGLVGGGVLMMPSIDKLYTSCDSCGTRQVVKKNQTACATCKSPFTMEKVAKFLFKK